MNEAAAKRRFSRRTMLRGAGVAVALPWLEATAGAAAYPKRLAVLFMGNGINGNHWWARGEGADMKLGKSLEPMEPLKAKMNYIHGLFNEPSTGVGTPNGLASFKPLALPRCIVRESRGFMRDP